MDKNTFDNTIDNFLKFTKEIFTPDGEDEYKIKLIETLNQIMQMEKHLTESSPNAENMDFPNEIWTKIIKYLPSIEDYASIILVNKRFQSLALKSGVCLNIKLDSRICEKKLESLKKFTAPLKFICSTTYFHPNYEKAISVAQNLRFLQFCGPNNALDKNVHECFEKLVDAIIQSRSELEHIDIINHFQVEPEIWIQISQIKSLRSIQISDVTPEILDAFAQSENQLEKVEFYEIGDDPDYPYYQYYQRLRKEKRKKLSISLNNFLKSKSNTLKSLNIIMSDIFCKSVPLTNLKLCQNLEEFCGHLNPHDIESLAQIPRLKKLKLACLKNPKYLFDHLNFGSLKYLSLEGIGCEANNDISQEFTKHNFPVLQRLLIDDIVELSENFLMSFIANAPNLKSIHLPYTNFIPNCSNHHHLWGSKCTVSNKFLYNFFNNFEVFVCFLNSKRFEEFLFETDLSLRVFQKYNGLKQSFEEWSSNNPEYSKF